MRRVAPSRLHASLAAYAYYVVCAERYARYAGRLRALVHLAAFEASCCGTSTVHHIRVDEQLPKAWRTSEVPWAALASVLTSSATYLAEIRRP